MKLKLYLVSLAIACLLIPYSAGASTVFETTGWIIGTEGLNFEFTADMAPSTYQATLTDLSEAPFGFENIFLSVTSSSDVLGSISDFGSFTFSVVEPGETLFANVFGIGEGKFDAGLFGLEVMAIPIPPGLILLGTSVFGLILLRRRVR